MHEQARRETTIQHEGHNGWWHWAEQHPGIVLLGALAVAVLALRDSPKTVDLESDPSSEEVPLFI